MLIINPPNQILSLAILNLIWALCLIAHLEVSPPFGGPLRCAPLETSVPLRGPCAQGFTPRPQHGNRLNMVFFGRFD